LTKHIQQKNIQVQTSPKEHQKKTNAP